MHKNIRRLLWLAVLFYNYFAMMFGAVTTVRAVIMAAHHRPLSAYCLSVGVGLLSFYVGCVGTYLARRIGRID